MTTGLPYPIMHYCRFKCEIDPLLSIHSCTKKFPSVQVKSPASRSLSIIDLQSQFSFSFAGCTFFSFSFFFTIHAFQIFLFFHSLNLYKFFLVFPQYISTNYICRCAITETGKTHHFHALLCFASRNNFLTWLDAALWKKFVNTRHESPHSCFFIHFLEHFIFFCT